MIVVEHKLDWKRSWTAAVYLKGQAEIVIE